MLYITTRSRMDAHTSFRTLASDRGEDGGLYVPFRFPKYTENEINKLREKPFRHWVSELLNIFFGSRLEEWDVDFSIGRYPSRIVRLNHRILVGETWRNPDWDFSRVVRNLAGRLQGTSEQHATPTNWSWVAVRVAVLFGLFSELERCGVADSDHCVDVAVYAGNLSAPVSVLYARRIGLPIGNLICSCEEDSPLWELIHDGRITVSAYMGQLPTDMERLIFETAGAGDALRYAEAVATGGVYTPGEVALKALRDAVRVVVVSKKRVEQIIPNVYRTGTYIMSPEAAMAYGGLLDHRSTAEEKRTSLILTEIGPGREPDAVARAMGLSTEELLDRINLF